MGNSDAKTMTASLRGRAAIVGAADTEVGVVKNMEATQIRVDMWKANFQSSGDSSVE
jgi:hypothetical protein